MKTPRRSHRSLVPAAPALVATLAAALLVTGCTDFIGSSNPQPTINAVLADEVREIGVSAGPGFIRFQGHITTVNRCQQLTAELESFSESAVAEIAVVAEALEPCPNDQETTWNYIGNVQNISAGTYDVTVTHRFENQDLPSQVVFEGQLTVEPR